MKNLSALIFIAALAGCSLGTEAMAASNSGTYAIPRGQSTVVTNPALPEVVPEAYYLTADGSDYGLAINRAVATGYPVRLACTTYNIATTIRYQLSGQIISGCGAGFAGDVGRTIIKWTGGTTGKVVSFVPTPGANGISNAQLRDVDIEGNSLANIGVEIYDNSAATGGGDWRNSLSHVTIRDVTGGSNPHGIELGHSNATPNFANDFSCYSCGLYNNGIGAWLSGSTEVFYNTAADANTVEGFRVEPGGNLQLHSCICYANGVDVSAHNPGNIALFGGSFQNSTNGIVVLDSGSTQNSVGVYGAQLHTASSSNLFNFQAAAGAVAIEGSTVLSGSASSLIAGINPTYSFSIAGSTGLTLPTQAAPFESQQVLAGAAVALTSTVSANITSISLPPGTWDVSGLCAYSPAGSTTTSVAACWVSPSSATPPTIPGGGYIVQIVSWPGGDAGTIATGTVRVTLGSTTTYYLSTNTTFAVSTIGGYGLLQAVRSDLSAF
jgi:hypothetical protein